MVIFTKKFTTTSVVIDLPKITKKETNTIQHPIGARISYFT